MAVLRSADQEQLQKLLLGQLSTADVERLATEYADDGRLEELAESLAGRDDALLALLHNHETAVVDPDGERLVERLLERLKPTLRENLREDTVALNKVDASTEPSSPDVSAKPQPLPERLEYYRPIKVLGQGGMGTVYLAEDTRLGREVAIKTLRPELAINPQAKERFLREARAAAKLEHDNIIPIYSVGEADGTPFLAMPLLKGEPLDALIRRTAAPQPVAMVVRLAREAASGLGAAHARGLIHRDIKPANLWLEAPTGRVKILDFGLAKAADAGSDTDSETNLTASGAIVGTPAYMAPEQASGQAVDCRADLFSLGCVMYELLAGKRAFSGPNTMSILMSLANHTPPAPDMLSPLCSAALSRLVMQLLEKDPANRPASAETVIQALAELDIECVQASRAATDSGPSQDAVVIRGLTPAGSSTLVESDLPRPSESSLALSTTAAFPVRRQAIPKQRVALALAGVLLMLLAAVVYRIQTDQGTLVVTIEDRAVQAILEPDGLVVRDKSSHRTWTIKATETKKLLPSGKYQVEGKPNLQLLVTDDSGAEVTTDTFALKRKREVRVRVTLEPGTRVAGKDVPMSMRSGATNELLPAKFTNALDMEFSLVPKGKAWLGGGNGTPGNKEVEFKDDFYIGVYEVTQEEWEKVMGTNPSEFKAVPGEDTKRFPVEQVSWDDCQEFIQRVNEQAKERGWEYRLPTGTEWEYACRGGPMKDKNEGAFDYYLDKPSNVLLPEQANFAGEKALGRACKVGSYIPNRLGLYDMHGNVWEWCDDYRNAKDAILRQATRGGGWFFGGNFDGDCRAAFRPTYVPSCQMSCLGLRLVRVLVRAEETTPKLAKVEPGPKIIPQFTNSLGMEFALVPKGKAWLGGGNGVPGNTEVEFKNDFYLGASEVTQEEWENVTGSNPSYFKAVPGEDTKRFPVEQVSWEDCQEFIKRLNEQVKERGWVYRLPTGAEWEYACRGGPMKDKFESVFDFYLEKPSNVLLPEQANFAGEKDLGRACKVVSYTPNRLGLYDMHGNVWEWCDDAANANDAASHRFVRGGGWFFGANFNGDCRAAIRFARKPSDRSGCLGLRLARVPIGTPEPAADSDRLASIRRFVVWALSRKGSVIPPGGGDPLEKLRDGSILHVVSFGEDPAVVKPLEDADLDAFQDFPGVENSLGFRFQNVTPAGLIKLGGLIQGKRINNLGLVDMPIGVSAFRQPGGFSQISGATFQNIDAKDDELIHLKNLKSLQQLNLRYNKGVTDAGLIHLGKIKTLKSLSLEWTSVTAAGIAKLHVALPQCVIQWDGGVIEPKASPNR